jgi:CheY-like chemotaxis protein
MVASTQRAHRIAKSCSQPATTILLVEDDPTIAHMYRFWLEYYGHRVHLAMTGAAALMLAHQSSADLVLLDIGLPAMDGLEVLTTLRADRRTSSLPVVILSNHDDPGLIQRGLQLGAIDYLIKSQVTPAGVSGSIARWMAARAAAATASLRPGGLAAGPDRQGRLQPHRDAFATGLQLAQGGFTCS